MQINSSAIEARRDQEFGIFSDLFLLNCSDPNTFTS